MYHQGSNMHLFELVLKSSYEDLYIIAKVKATAHIASGRCHWKKFYKGIFPVVSID